VHVCTCVCGCACVCVRQMITMTRRQTIAQASYRRAMGKSVSWCEFKVSPKQLISGWQRSVYLKWRFCVGDVYKYIYNFSLF